MQIINFESFNPNFQAMKPNQFKGIDYAIVRKFKAPVEKFNSNSDFQTWAGNKLEELKDTEFPCKTYHAHYERKFVLNKWIDFLTQKASEWSQAKLLLIYSAITKGLKENNSDIPPIIKLDILNKTFENLEQKLDENKNLQFNFNEMYQTNLSSHFLKDIPKDYTGWLILPSERNDRANFEDNVEKLKLLSNKTWCTQKWYHAETYLAGGDFHAYLENGVPKLGIRFSGCEIQEVQGEKNNSVIPKNYLELVKKYIMQNNFYISNEALYLIEMSEKAQ